MKKRYFGLAILAAMLVSLAAVSCSKKESTAGKMVMYGYGQPQYWAKFFTNYLADHQDTTKGVTFEMIQTEGEADARQKIQMSFTAGAYNDLPDVTMTQPVSMQALAEGGVLMDVTDFVNQNKNLFIPGTFDEIEYKGKYFALPTSLRPQLIFYNAELFEQYGIDPAEMDTFDGYIEVGRKLKRLSGGKTYLSYVDPRSQTWRYWGRRGLMPQAGAKIWDDQGNVVIDTDPGAKRAFTTFATLFEENLLLKSRIMEPPLYESCRNGEVATFYIGAFWDEFLRMNLPDMAGKWRVRPAPMYQDIGRRGAPVIAIEAIVNKPNGKYADLYKAMWLDFHTNPDSRKKWTDEMEAQNAPYTNPITTAMLDDPYWKEPSPYYGGQSFREAEGFGLQDAAVNMRVTVDDAEADSIISSELEKYVAGDQTMNQAIQNMGKVLRDRIGKTSAK
ncbi:ABC transporter substrate-binding protein [Breznakiella homolactica]|uniref:Carbohydrate ABC transporter substrate-binding protein n=1 Tax=Breznakiella homolactica TaxID=2798577 RepID=A0A7T8BB90_9SPIR|nr:ABC transporter substrate-binding protein [Breznakiella homolactica]QQO10307.1 ABC transporter substrate-binding protein [Breznakiella homolactica]